MLKISKSSEKFNNDQKYDWLIISQSYFQCALMNARVLKEKLSEYGASRYLNQIYGNYQQSPEYLIFPILFNFKHGIEIYLKAVIGIKNSKFTKGHNLIAILAEAGITDFKIKCIVEKYAYSRLLLINNEKCDTENQFERYPQGNPYDNLELFSIEMNKKYADNFYAKINELIDDIEYLYKNIRDIARQTIAASEKELKIS